jgi:4-hydroxyphenylacetate 3-monooxygenase
LCEPLFNARQTGLDKQQAVQEKPALLACYREGINAHLMAAIAIAFPPSFSWLGPPELQLIVL